MRSCSRMIAILLTPECDAYAHRLDLCREVTKRLVGTVHKPAVQEVLGCLIPVFLDRRQDGKRPHDKTRADVRVCSVALEAGSWKINIGDEQALSELRMCKGVAEFS